MISCIRSVWKCSQMLSLYSVVGGPKVDQMISTFSILLIVWSASGFLIFSHFFSFFLFLSHCILSVVVLCSIVEGWVFSFFLIFSHFISFFLISSHCISFLMKKCIYMHHAAVWCINCYFGKKEICQKIV